MGENWPMNFVWKCPTFTCLKKKPNGFGWGLNPRTLVPKASTLPLEHRSRHRHAVITHFNIIFPIFRDCSRRVGITPLGWRFGFLLLWRRSAQSNKYYWFFLLFMESDSPFWRFILRASKKCFIKNKLLVLNAFWRCLIFLLLTILKLLEPIIVLWFK